VKPVLKPRLAAQLRRLAAAALLLAAVPIVLAQELAPDQLMRTLSDEVIASIRQDKDIGTVVEAKILPHFDFARSTQIALGANWRRATPEQQERLIREFRTLLVRTYSGALASYSGQTIEFRPLRAGAADTEVTVRSQVRQPGAEPIAIDYDMHKSGAAWKVFDVRISGISLVATYRSAFNDTVRNHGIDGLIGTLASKNRGG
jgi:phospholipid transport system substrate-binding protein